MFSAVIFIETLQEPKRMKNVGKLYLSEISSPVRSVLLTIKALEIIVDHIPLDLKNGEHLQPDFLRINPQHTVPTYVDNDGTVVWDSHAINSFLVDKYDNDNSNEDDDNTLYPRNLARRAMINQRMFFEASVMYPLVRRIVLPIIQQKRMQLTVEVLQDIQMVYDFLEQFLDGRPYIADMVLTIADFSIITTAMTLDFFVPIVVAKHPLLIKWLLRCQELPYFIEANAGLLLFKEFIHGLTD